MTGVQTCALPIYIPLNFYHIVGDLAETIALIIPTTKEHSDKSLTEYLQEIIALKKKTDIEKKEYLQENWLALNYYERFVFTKLITGSFRIGVSQKLMTRALSKAENIDEDSLAHKLMGDWNPNTITFQELILDEKNSDYLSVTNSSPRLQIKISLSRMMVCDRIPSHLCSALQSSGFPKLDGSPSIGYAR